MRGHENVSVGALAARLRAREKELLILRYLRQEVWASLKVLSIVIGIRTPRSVTPTLQRMAQLGWLRQHLQPVLGGWSIPLWGITLAGQRWIAEHDGLEPLHAGFEPWRLGESKLRHDLEVQEVHARGLHAGWTNWVNGNRMKVLLPGEKRPDALATSPSGHRTALEVERTFKAGRRYEGVLSSYLQALKEGDVAQVIWLFPHDDRLTQVRDALLAITSVPVDGIYYPVEPARHHRALFFVTYVEWEFRAAEIGLA
jgi:hypothetical protein